MAVYSWGGGICDLRGFASLHSVLSFWFQVLQVSHCGPDRAPLSGGRFGVRQAKLIKISGCTCVCGGGVLKGVEMEMRECYPWALLAVLVLDIEPISGGGGGCLLPTVHKLWTDLWTRTFISSMIEKHSITAFPHDWRPASGSSRSFLV